MNAQIIIVLSSLMAIASAIPADNGEEGYGQVQDEQPMPYEFEYNVDDGEGTRQGRQETADGTGTVKGWYGYNDANGVYRRVDYIADREGFRAQVNTNEPGTSNDNPANVQMRVEEPIQTQAAIKIPVYADSRPIPKILKLQPLPGVYY